MAIQVMQVGHLKPMVDRGYRESSRFQWGRELIVNALEAHATRIWMGAEPQAQAAGIFRLMIADNGEGMGADQLLRFINTYGMGDKRIGGALDNFGIGAKVALLPWNPYGLVVISRRWGETHMVWLCAEHVKATGMDEYGAKFIEHEDEEGNACRAEVYAPFVDAVHHCDWRRVLPSWIDEHGTAVVLLGRHARDNTCVGAPNRDEQAGWALASYIGQRFWSFPDGVRVSMQLPLAGTDDAQSVARLNNLRIRSFLERVEMRGMQAQGTVRLPLDGVEVDWFLTHDSTASADGGDYGARKVGGGVACRIGQEMYGFQGSGAARLRMFGVVGKALRARINLVVRPPAYEDGVGRGAYPSSDRSRLLWHDGQDIPWDTWGQAFCEEVPTQAPALAAVIEATYARAAEADLADPEMLRRIEAQFTKRFRIPLLRAVTDPLGPVMPVPSTESGGDMPGGSSGGRGAGTRTPRSASAHTEERRRNAGLPPCHIVGPDDMDAPEQTATFCYRMGTGEVIYLNRDSPLIREQVRYYQEQYPRVYTEQVRATVLSCYRVVLQCYVAHVSHYGRTAGRSVQKQLLEPDMLAARCLGIVDLDALILNYLKQKVGRRTETERAQAHG